MAAKYMSGFGNSFETEALPGALPVGRNSPQKVNYGLYAEQLSGSPFTAPQATNQRTWLYRIRPTVRHTGRFQKIDPGLIRTAPAHDETRPADRAVALVADADPQDARSPSSPGCCTMTTAGDAEAQAGMASHLLLVTKSMEREHFFNADGEMLIVAQQDKLRFRTEFGMIEIEPGEICVIPRGVIFRVELIDGPARGYVCENYGGAFKLPDRGPIGANCLANARDFLGAGRRLRGRREAPHALCQMGRRAVTAPSCRIRRSTWWPGTATTIRTNTTCGGSRRSARSCSIIPIPSIYTVLTSPSETAGTANIDFVIFPERWAVAENTFRPPWYHRNIMSEFMGLVYGVYDAKPEGFVPGGMSLHNQMLPHGPDTDAFEQASNAELKPVKLTNTLAFMFETRFRQRLTKYAADAADPSGRLHRLLERPEEALQPEAAEAEVRPYTGHFMGCAQRARPE